MEYEKSLVLVTSADQENNTSFGTGFVINQNGRYSYILTCAHVVSNDKDQQRKVEVNSVSAKVVAIGNPGELDDLAILEVEELFGDPLSMDNIGYKGLAFTSKGYQRIMPDNAMRLVLLEGKLEEAGPEQIVGQGLAFRSWRLNSTNGFLPGPGYSGAPIVVDTDEGERVIGVFRRYDGNYIYATSIEVLEGIWPEPPYVPFTNRDDERISITSSSAPPYYLLDAPAGYGKSSLLRVLQKEFLELKWICAYLFLDSSFDLDKLTEAIAKKLSISGLLPNRIVQGAGSRLGVALRKYWRNSKDKQGIVLLFDLDTNPNNAELLENLLKKFIFEVRESLKKTAPFNSSINRFRVIIAGRFLKGIHYRLSIPPLPISITHRYLIPFTYEIVQESATRYLEYTAAPAEQIAEHILYLTGGHPGCMAAVLQWYKESGMLPENFVEEHSDRIWNEIVKPVVTKITNEFPTTFGVHKLMSNNVLRYMDYAALRMLVDTLEISEVRDANNFDEIDLSDELRGTALLNWNNNNYLLHDDITRRLICLGLRNDRREEFMRLCQVAQTICEERLRDTTTPTPDKWTIEYLFQFLQQHILLISEPEQRQKLRDNFISQELPKVLEWLAAERRPREQQRFLLRSIEDDWEFMFTVNYYLRDAEYNNDAVEELISEVNVFFEKRGKA